MYWVNLLLMPSTASFPFVCGTVYAFVRTLDASNHFILGRQLLLGIHVDQLHLLLEALNSL